MLNKKRKVLLITERRADYSRFKPIINEIKKDKILDYRLVVTGLHLLKSHGNTKNEIKSDNFKISKEIKNFQDDGKNTTGAGMAKAMGKVFLQLSEYVEKIKPDIILSGFDIGANFVLTVVGAHLNIPVAHIQGGEVTGSIDESLRHAMSKFSNYHYVANNDAKKRLVKMGEISKDVHVVGCPSIDALLLEKELNLKKLLKKFRLNEKKKFLLLIQHPITTEVSRSENQIVKTLKAIRKSSIQTLIILPNNDSGYLNIVKKIKKSEFRWTKTLTLSEYKTLLKNCSVLVGNSSSGIHEASTFKIPVVNIGSRQNKRLKPKNVVNVAHDEKQIFKAIKLVLKKSFKAKISKIKNPYGNGRSAKKIVNLLKNIDLSRNTQKTINY
jgi:UDP-hydrolysing UDP-N-acetyl-D-glucosamine 2-epimerase